MPNGDEPAVSPKSIPAREPSPPPACSLFASCFSQMEAFSPPPRQAYTGHGPSNSPSGRIWFGGWSRLLLFQISPKPPSALGDPS